MATSVPDDPVDRALTLLRDSPSDPSGWRELYRDLWPYVIAICFRTLKGRRQEAEDVAQTVFLRLARTGLIQRFDSAQQLRAYVGKMAHNCSIDFLRTEARTNLREPTPIESGLANPSPLILEWLVVDEQLQRIIAALSSSDHALLEYVLEGLSTEELCERLSTTPAATRVRLHRLRNRIRKLLAAG
jgi:RNA polymerase sigma-70 factor (ECF subfamily)